MSCVTAFWDEGTEDTFFCISVRVNAIFLARLRRPNQQTAGQLRLLSSRCNARMSYRAPIFVSASVSTGLIRLKSRRWVVAWREIVSDAYHWRGPVLPLERPLTSFGCGSCAHAAACDADAILTAQQHEFGWCRRLSRHLTRRHCDDVSTRFCAVSSLSLSSFRT